MKEEAVDWAWLKIYGRQAWEGRNFGMCGDKLYVEMVKMVIVVNLSGYIMSR